MCLELWPVFQTFGRVHLFLDRDCATGSTITTTPDQRAIPIKVKEGSPMANVVKKHTISSELVFRVIHTIHPVMKHLAQYRFTGESRCLPQKWIPAFAGKARRGFW